MTFNRCIIGANAHTVWCNVQSPINDDVYNLHWNYGFFSLRIDGIFQIDPKITMHLLLECIMVLLLHSMPFPVSIFCSLSLSLALSLCLWEQQRSNGCFVCCSDQQIDHTIQHGLRGFFLGINRNRIMSTRTMQSWKMWNAYTDRTLPTSQYHFIGQNNTQYKTTTTTKNYW